MASKVEITARPTVQVKKDLFPLGVRRRAAKAGSREAVRIIRERTLRGVFAAQGSSGSRARRYNPDYARRVGKGPGGPVNLFVTGDLHNSIFGTFFFGSRGARARQVELFARVKGSSAQQKKRWLQDMGAGRNRIKRRFMYFTKAEGRRIVNVMLRAISTDPGTSK